MGHFFLAGPLARVGAAESESVAPLSLRVDERVEGGHRVDFDRMHTEDVGDELHSLAVDLAVRFFDVAEYGLSLIHI